MAYHTLTPAYGAIYTTKAQVTQAWDANKDFRLATTGQYVNKSGAARFMAGDKFQIRYGKNLEKVIIR